jgi:hypothetical protein
MEGISLGRVGHWGNFPSNFGSICQYLAQSSVESLLPNQIAKPIYRITEFQWLKFCFTDQESPPH